MGNFHWYPSNKNNLHKIKNINSLTQDAHILTILETGNNQNNKLWTANDKLLIKTENYMKTIEKDQY